MTVPIEELISRGVAASRPAAEDAVAYYATDTRVLSLSDGATWTDFVSLATTGIYVSATDRLLGRDSSGAGLAEEITASNARTMLSLAPGTDIPALAHSHAGTSNGSKLAQANTHESPDTDSGTSSLHHTIGSGANQAAAGNHSHAGGSFDPDEHLPWHVVVLPTVWTSDATTGSWSLASATVSGATYPFYVPGSTANSGGETRLVSSAQNDAIAYDVILAAGTWDANIYVQKASNCGIITLNQDGASQGTVDTYNASIVAATVSITGWTVATSGKHRMQLLMSTKNGSSSAYVLSVMAIEFRRTA